MACTRLGLCCLFDNVPQIKFRATTVKHLTKISNEGGRDALLRYVSEIVLHNAASLTRAVAYCGAHDIGCFRINSQLWPCYTHKVVGYTLEDLPDYALVRDRMQRAGRLAALLDVRLSMHPDQFVVLNSQKPPVVDASVAELEYQNRICELVGADVLNIHGGGGFGDKPVSLARLIEVINSRLSPACKSRLTLVNDDKTYTPEDLLPVCNDTGVPLLYDVHHHRCTAGGSSNLSDSAIEKITIAAKETWNGREPMFHISSPINGWGNKETNRHHDFIDYAEDYPLCWRRLQFSFALEVEAKKKETAVVRLKECLLKDGVRLTGVDDKLKQSAAQLWPCQIDQLDAAVLNLIETAPKAKNGSGTVMDACVDAPLTYMNSKAEGKVKAGRKRQNDPKSKDTAPPNQKPKAADTSARPRRAAASRAILAMASGSTA